MNITLLAKKGGVGKSTVSILLYEAIRLAGKSVALRDWDEQGTSSKTMRILGTQKEEPKHAAVTIYDTPPNLSHTAAATAVRNAGIVLIVTSPSPADIWEANEAVEFAREKNPKARIRVMFNKVRRSTVLGRLVEESAKEVKASTLPIMLSARECYQHAVAQGWKALDPAAREEVLQLVVALLSFK